MNKVVEICCGSYYDAVQAALGGAERIELNSALMLGGLTPTASTLRLVKEAFPRLKVIAMVRPRGAGFCYREEEFQVMKAECAELLSNGADGIAFGCLTEGGNVNVRQTEEMLSLIHCAKKDAVFHRAFDCVQDPFDAMEQLIALGVNRVLTSGLQPKAVEGAALLKELQTRFGARIEILAGSGINASNAGKLMQETGILQVHSSCKDWLTDPTTVQNGVSYSIAPGAHKLDYDVVSKELVAQLIASVDRTEI